MQAMQTGIQMSIFKCSKEAGVTKSQTSLTPTQSQCGQIWIDLYLQSILLTCHTADSPVYYGGRKPDSPTFKERNMYKNSCCLRCYKLHLHIKKISF